MKNKPKKKSEETLVKSEEVPLEKRILMNYLKMLKEQDKNGWVQHEGQSDRSIDIIITEGSRTVRTMMPNLEALLKEYVLFAKLVKLEILYEDTLKEEAVEHQKQSVVSEN